MCQTQKRQCVKQKKTMCQTQKKTMCQNTVDNVSKQENRSNKHNHTKSIFCLPCCFDVKQEMIFRTKRASSNLATNWTFRSNTVNKIFNANCGRGSVPDNSDGYLGNWERTGESVEREVGVLVGVGRECVRVEREREVCVCVCVLKGSACVQRKSVLGKRECVLRERER